MRLPAVFEIGGMETRRASVTAWLVGASPTLSWDALFCPTSTEDFGGRLLGDGVYRFDGGLAGSHSAPSKDAATHDQANRPQGDGSGFGNRCGST